MWVNAELSIVEEGGEYKYQCALKTVELGYNVTEEAE
jgi:hypothetical protein